MANTKSAIKREKIAEKRHARNVAVKSATRTFVKKARTAIATSPAEAQADIIAAVSALDRAAKKGVIHKNNASRRKSRLMKALNTAVSAAAAPVEEATEAKKPTRARSTGTKGRTGTTRTPKK
jgi:small subunit ribosomal protein S20